METLNTTQTELITEIIAFGKGRGFDFDNMTKESLNGLMKLWIKVGKDFTNKASELPLNQVKPLMSL